MIDWIKEVRKTLSSVLRGKKDVIELALVCLIARGHLLIEDIPGVGKTTLALALARVTDCTFQRIQFTSDLLPSDILGVHIYNPETREFEFKEGPVFANIVLADEINRTNPKTQSALLEAMNERKVSIDREVYQLPEPFMVIATQNPMEYHGTFPLPESQLDRFMLHLRIGYPSYQEEKAVVLEMRDFDHLMRLTPVVTRDQILEAQQLLRDVHVEDSVADYLMGIVVATRGHPEIRLGVSTRGAQHLLRAAKAHALIQGRDFLLPEDVKRVAPWVLAHRVLLKGRTFIRDAEEVIVNLLKETEVPL